MIASLALVASIHAVDYIPTNDGPQVVLDGFMENHYSDPGSFFPTQVEPSPQFAHRGFAFLFLPLESLFGWRSALRLSLSIIGLTTAFGFVALVSALSPDRRFLGLLGFAVALGWNFYMGFFAFEFATGIGLFILAGLVHRPKLTAIGWLLLSIALGFQAVSHVFSAALTGGVLALVVLFRSPPDLRIKELGKLALAGLPAMGIFFAAFSQHGELQKVAFSTEFVSLGIGERFAQFPHMVSPGPSPRSWLAVAAILSALVLAFVRWKSLQNPERALALASTMLLGTAFLAPLHVPGWQYASPRFLPLGVLAALALLPLERIHSSFLRAWTIVACVSAALSSSWISAGLHQRLYASCAAELSGLDRPIRRKEMQLPIFLGRGTGSALNREVPHMDPILHLGALFPIEHGGSIPYLFTGSSAIHAFRERQDSHSSLPVPTIDRYWAVLDAPEFTNNPAFRRKILTELAFYGTYYESIIALRARPDDVAELEARGYVADWSSGSVFLGHFSSCSASIEVSGAAGATRVALGLSPLRDPIQQLTVPAPDGDGNGAHVRVIGIPCGQVWMRVVGDTGDPGTSCAEAGKGGLVRANLERGTLATIRCSLR